MQLSLRTFSQLLQDMGAVVQGSATRLIDLSVGSVLRSILEANASVALWIQWLLVLVLQATRASTSTGNDLDTWMSDFTLTRLPASSATAIVTFSRLSPAIAATIPAGALIKTNDGSATFSVAVDTTNAAWSETAGGYQLPAGTSSVPVPVSCQTAGSVGNVQANTITLMATPLVGVDSVTNALPAVGGADAETDAAFRLRFQNFIGSRSRATLASVEFAITSVQAGVSYLIQENSDAGGNYRPGWFLVIVDDGSGYPSSELLASITQSIETMRPIGSGFSVQAPTVVTADIAVNLTVQAGTLLNQVTGPVSTAITAYINALPVGAFLSVTRLIQVCYAASSAISNISSITINGQATDLTPPTHSVIKAGSVAVT